MLAAHKIKVLQSLDKKKFRQKYNLFLVEGNKTIKDLFNSRFKIRELYSVEPEKLGEISADTITKIDERALRKISFLQHPKDSVAVCELLPTELLDCSFNIVLDGLQDPGNLGTIIRLADWFGIEQIVCSEDCVDFYNPKVIQATMGSFTRVNIVYEDLKLFLSKTKNVNLGADMDGDNIYQTQFPERINLIMGNEGNGLRSSTLNLLQQKISIPKFGRHKSTESLNVSMATSIILGEIFSRL